MRRSPKTVDTRSLRIVMQYRERLGMAYELECDGAQLSVRVQPRACSSDPGDWRIDARLGRGDEAQCVTGWAVTRTDALREVGRRWRADTHGLPSFDWEEVERALAAVRAL